MMVASGDPSAARAPIVFSSVLIWILSSWTAWKSELRLLVARFDELSSV